MKGPPARDKKFTPTHASGSDNAGLLIGEVDIADAPILFAPDGTHPSAKTAALQYFQSVAFVCFRQ
jgi:hypothetical protein